jgi:hypothetical protein
MAKPKTGTQVNPAQQIDPSVVSPSRTSPILWYLAVIPSIWSFGFTTMWGSDLWWHIATGRLILAQRALPLSDSWSFTREGQPWLQHEWLSDLGFQAWVSLFGLNSLVYWKWSILILTFLLLFHLARRLTGDSIASYAAVLIAVATAAPFLDIRPHLYSALGYVLLLCLTLLREKPPQYLPLIFLIWVNLHGGYFFGLMALTVLLLPSILPGRRYPDRRRTFIIWLSCVSACLVNPNGVRVFTYPLKYAFDSSSPFAQAIGEWLSPFVSGGISAPLYPHTIGMFLGSLVVLRLRRAHRSWRSTWPALALALLALAMSLTSRRFIVLFAISQSLIVAPALATLIPAKVHRIPRTVAPAFVALLGIIWLFPYPLSAYAFHYLTVEDAFPIETCNFIEANQLSGNVFSYYNWGGYLHLRTDGRFKVYIDGRADTVYDNETMRRYAAVQGFKPGWEEIIESSGAQYILWPRSEQGKPLAQMVSSGRWRVLYDDFVSVLLVRGDHFPTGALNPTADSAYRRVSEGIKNLELRRFTEAERDFRGALVLMPYMRLACDSLAQAQAQQGNTQPALRTMEQCQRIFPDHDRANIVRSLLR